MGDVFYVALAQVEVLDVQEAIQGALEHCREQLAGRRAGAALLFAGVDLDHPFLLKAIQAEWPGIPVLGGTTDGELSSQGGYTEDSFVLLLLGSETASFASGVLDLTQPLEPQAEQVLERVSRRQAQAPRLGILVADGLSSAAEDALLALQEAFGPLFPWLGGTSADRWTFRDNKQFHGTQVLQQSAVYLVLCGEFRYGFAVDAGWKPIGRTGVVTRAVKNVVHEIDGKPAMAFYRELMGVGATPSVDTPTAVCDPCGGHLFLRTSIQPLDPEGDSITYSARVAEGSLVQVTLVDRDSIVEAVGRAVRRAKGMLGIGRTPTVALCFSCAARRAILGSRTPDECRATCEILGPLVPVAGFYAYGEICPREPKRPSLFHNETFAILLLG